MDISATKASLKLLLVGTACSSILVPITVALFFFSTAQIRRQPIFLLNVVSVVLGIVEGILTGYSMVQSMLGMPAARSVGTTYAMLVILIPLFTESILILRVYAVYPPWYLTRSVRAAVYGPIVVFKATRIAISVSFIVQWQKMLRDSTDPLQTAAAAWRTPFTKCEWILQLLDNSYTSTLFLIKLRSVFVHNQQLSRSSGSTTSEDPYARRLKVLLWIAASNFVIPVMLNILQLVFAFRETDFIDGICVFLVNNYVEIVGTILATIWSCSGGEAAGESASGPYRVGMDASHTSTLQFTTITRDTGQGHSYHCPSLQDLAITEALDEQEHHQT
ncbi:hypothetical protein FKP32DRAFT_1568348 [Trametes sanguinea]|nr:hypothetical protein FKP32DRAFT_1568348 [Trametes sanguinea]